MGIRLGQWDICDKDRWRSDPYKLVDVSRLRRKVRTEIVMWESSEQR